MSSPCFYMSEFFEHRNNEYQDRLLAVSSDGDWTGWCSFFLEAVAAQARENPGKAKRINLLYRDVRMGLVEESHSTFAEKAADALFSRPIFPRGILRARRELSRKPPAAFWERWRRWALLRSSHLTAVSVLRFSIFPPCLLLPRICNRNSGVIHVPQIDLRDMDG